MPTTRSSSGTDSRRLNDPILVTGGSGHVGSHLVSRLLLDGHRVRATVRSPARETSLREAVAAAGADPGDRLDICHADLSADDGWAAATAGCAYVHHVASPLPAGQPRDDDELIVPARDGALRVLRAARDAGVARVVMTSSFTAVGYSRKASDEYDERDWTDPADDNTAYTRSKTIAERAAWDFARTEADGLELAVINPTGIFGPLLGPHLSVSTMLVKTMLDGDMPVAPRVFFGVVDVRDVVDLHVRAMIHPAAAGQRFLAGSGEMISFLHAARILSDHLGELAAKVPKLELADEQVRAAARTNPELRAMVDQLGRIPVVHADKAREVLGWQPRAPETAIADTADSLIRLGLVASRPSATGRSATFGNRSRS
ncbi:NAD-dependent epimerase/dehydratase family protein [Nonomuraea sp. NPDC050022]|uniref:NAD-dependent epimerase/dehydratase family protein n=1 Tax=Nonomuraea sp. NPDC050022 TaxID=3364358 RepID=UPI00378BF8F2